MKPTTLGWLALAVGCTGLGGKTEDTYPSCAETRTALPLDEVTALGFSAEQLLARLPAAEAVVFTYEDGATTDADPAFAPDGAASWVDSEAVYPEGTSPAIGVICDDYVEVQVSWTFATVDGVFDEVFDSPLRATTLEAAGLSGELDLGQPGGTFAIDDYTDETGYDEARASVRVVVGDGSTSGVVEGQVSGGGDCEDGEVCTAWAATVAVGSWGTAEE
jgi:hypothetical protein